MSYSKRFLLLGSILLLAAGWFTFGSHTAPKAFAASINGCPPTLKENSSSNNSSWVEVLQYTLNSIAAEEQSYQFTTYPLSVDGSFGPNTEVAVDTWKSYWDFNSYEGTGVVGPVTWSSLGLCLGASSIYFHGNSVTHGNCPSTLSNGSSGILVIALQDMLDTNLAAGGFSDTPDPFTVYLANDGSFGPQTEDATVDFQHASGIQDNGEVGPQTWDYLGMCY